MNNNETVNSQSSDVSTEPQIIEFGPYRVIGMRYAGKNENMEIKTTLWEGETGFLKRCSEIQTPADCDIAFGICRCLPGVTDGSFEYIAAVPAAADADIPEGMVEAHIAACRYVVFAAASLDELGQTWDAIGPWFAEHPEWASFCNETKCDCATHPGFEFYPPEFGINGRLFLYVPIRPAE